MKPLSVGNVVSAGLRIYRDNFKKYYTVAFIGALWSWIPIYGWAKFAASMGLVSRLAFGEVTENPETLKDARRYTNSKMWYFLGAAFAVGLRFLGAYLLWIVLFLFLIVIVGIVGSIGGNSLGIIATLLSFVVGLISFVSFLGLIIWLIARYLIVDLPIAVETDITVSSAIKRSVDLTKGQIVHIYLVVIVAALISIPLYAVAVFIQVIPSILESLNLEFLQPLILLISLVTSSATSAFIAPVWQSIKAVIYYDLLIRKEGLGLELDNENDFSLE